MHLRDDFKHSNLRWNPATREWFCLKCGRTSEHAAEKDAATELSAFSCELPVAQLPDRIACD